MRCATDPHLPFLVLFLDVLDVRSQKQGIENGVSSADQKVWIRRPIFSKNQFEPALVDSTAKHRQKSS